MFTGLIEEVGKVERMERKGKGARLRVKTGPDIADLKPGESISVNGVCLTVAEANRGIFRADISEDSLARSTIGKLTPGEKVNLERALRADGRFGGHFILGHIDGIAVLREPLANVLPGGRVVLDVENPEQLSSSRTVRVGFSPQPVKSR